MRLRTLRWLTVVVPLLFLALVDWLRHVLLPELLHPWPGYLLVLAVVTAGVYLTSRTIFDHIETIEARLLEQNRELREVGETSRRQAAQLAALHEASLALLSELDLETVLQRVVDLARELAGARYGALSVVDERGGIVRFLTSGLSSEERARLGAPPRGAGLLGVALSADRPLRLDDIGREPRSRGFPPNHPPMTTLLGVPIVARGRTFGNLYLTDKVAATGIVPFDPADEEVLRLFAAQAAIAMENARLYADLEGLAAAAERERIARELHDSLAQALGYVRLRAASARDALGRGQPEAVGEALDQIREVAGQAYADVREAILGLRNRVAEQRSLPVALAEYLEQYRLQTGVETVLETAPEVEQARAALDVEAQLLRIVQEALTNVRKHAHARRARVSLEVVSDPSGPRLRATVADDGRGFDPARLPAEARFGLQTMRERAEAAGGRLEIEARNGQGTRVTVAVPLEAGPSQAVPVSPGQES